MERSVEEAIRELPLGIEVILRMQDGTEVAARVGGSGDDAVVVEADGTEVDLAHVEDVLLEGVTEGPE